MSFIPKPHEIYKHFKGNLYQIVTIAEHSETGEQLVIYQALYGDYRTYARPLSMFVGKVDKEKYPDASQEFRFELQGAEDRRAERVTESVESRDTKATADTVNAANIENTADTVDTAEKADTADVAETADDVLDPALVEFLDADSYETRLNILAGLHHRITDEMITTMAIACDVEVGDGELETRYESLRNCLLTLEKYECNRIQ